MVATPGARRVQTSGRCSATEGRLSGADDEVDCRSNIHRDYREVGKASPIKAVVVDFEGNVRRKCRNDTDMGRPRDSQSLTHKHIAIA